MLFKNNGDTIYVDEKRIVAVDDHGCANYRRTRLLLDTGQSVYIDGAPYQIAHEVNDEKRSSTTNNG